MLAFGLSDDFEHSSINKMASNWTSISAFNDSIKALSIRFIRMGMEKQRKVNQRI